MEELISIIVPVYNSKQYIRDCAASILEQTYPHFELILVDDGSEDGSKDICRKLCEQDERLSLVACRHGGVSAARNAGIEASKGKYLFFLDSDDIIHPQLLEFLYRLMMETKAAVGTQRRYLAAGESRQKPEEWRMEMPDEVEYSCLKNEEALDCKVFASSKTALSGIGGKMILRSALGTVRFHEELSHGEDTLFMYQILSEGADVLVLCRDWYCYRKHEGGTIDRLSVRGCSSIYRAECYIRDQELKKGRKENALAWELAILNTIIRWYKAGRRDHDSVLMRYAKSRMDMEKKQGIFLQISRMKRWEINLLFCCYPLRHMYLLYPYIERGTYFLYLFVERSMHFWHRLSACPGRYYRKVLNLVHIHRWRVRWAYKNVKWKAVWAGQMTYIMIRRAIWKIMDVRHVVLHRKEHLDDK